MGDRPVNGMKPFKRHLALAILAMAQITIALSRSSDVYLRELPEETNNWRGAFEAVGRCIRRAFQCIRAIFVDDRVRRRTRSPQLERGELWSNRLLVAPLARHYGATLRHNEQSPRVVAPPAVQAPAPSYGSAETVFVESQSAV